MAEKAAMTRFKSLQSSVCLGSGLSRLPGPHRVIVQAQKSV